LAEKSRVHEAVIEACAHRLAALKKHNFQFKKPRTDQGPGLICSLGDQIVKQNVQIPVWNEVCSLRGACGLAGCRRMVCVRAA